MVDLISYAFDSNKNLISLLDAVKGENYFCPCCSCSEPFIFRKGKIKRPHFAHKTDSNCSSESIFHKVAKISIQKSIIDFLRNGGERPYFIRHCSLCLGDSRFFHKQRFPDVFDDVLLEYRLSSGFIVDVALMSKGVCLAAIEVVYTHKVDDYKVSNIGIPFLEVCASYIIDNPMEFNSTFYGLKDFFPNFESKSCFERQEQLKKEQQDWEFSFLQGMGVITKEPSHPFCIYLKNKFPNCSYFFRSKNGNWIAKPFRRSQKYFFVNCGKKLF